MKSIEERYMKKVLVYPCGTEIGLEVYRALQYSTHFEIIGGSSSYDHGRFVFKKHIDGLPFITDNSDRSEIEVFLKRILSHKIEYIYPAMDGVLTVFAKYRDVFEPEITIITPDYLTTQIVRSKKKTYQLFQDKLPIPKLFEAREGIESFPVFIKPDIGQGSVGTKRINSHFESQQINFSEFVCMEYLPGREFTVDCFTNTNGRLVFVRGRCRKRVKSGISVNAYFVERPEFREFAEIINSTLKQKGGWFFQLKEDKNGELRLLEISARIAGTSAITRNIGVNLPLLTLEIFAGATIENVLINDYQIEMDRALSNCYRTSLAYSTVYIDYDDTIVIRNRINLEVIRFLYQCVNKNIRIILISKHLGDLKKELKDYKIYELFDEIYHIKQHEEKNQYITDKNAIFIDDSYGERVKIQEKFCIPVFDTHMVECLLEG